MHYAFKVAHRQFKPGDPVPESYPAGVVRTMLDAHRIVPVVSEASPPTPRRGRRANRTETQHSGDG